MTGPQIAIFGLLAATMAGFVSGRLRHDVVALAALVGAVVLGLVPGRAAFAGFGEPAVITVALVLVLSRTLQVTGAVDALARAVLPKSGGAVGTLAVILTLGAGLSAFMNNVGAMALLMPVAIRIAPRLGLTPGQTLMPLAFATVLGGTITLIGTPPNLIISGLRAQAGLGEFAMFDFAPVGLAITVAGIAALVLVVRHLVPARTGLDDGFKTGAYFTEARLPATSRLVGKTINEAEEAMAQAGAQITGLVRGDVHLTAPRGSRVLKADDLIVIEAELEALATVLSGLGLELEEHDDARPKGGADVQLREYVVRPGSGLVGRTPLGLALRSVHGINLIAASRSGRRQTARLREFRIASGDVLLLQGPAEALSGFTGAFGMVPLAEREFSVPSRRKAAGAAAIMAGAIALATFGLLPTAVAFAAGVVAVLVLGLLPLRELYESIDWSVIVLLGALIPVAGAFEATGAAELVARSLVGSLPEGSALMALGLLIALTMTFSDIMNNAATAAVMTPIAIGIAQALGAHPDAFIMAVAVGASCSFLTPIGHQNNTLILGPGGFRFGDYWKPGLALELVVWAVAMVTLPLVWPL